MTNSLAGYGLHIDRNGRHALRSCLPLANWAQLQDMFLSSGARLYFRNTQLGILAEKDDAQLSGKSMHEVERSGIGRLELQDALLKGLDDVASSVVKWNRRFTHYEELSAGCIRAHFSDGTFEDGNLLVGADGPNSVVRQQFLPDFNRLYLGIEAIAGRFILNDDNIDTFPTTLTDGSLNNIVPSGNGWMFSSAWTAASVNNLKASAPERYLVWAYVLPQDKTTTLNSKAQGNELIDFVLDATKTWATELRTLVSGSDLATVKRLSLRSMPPVPLWRTSSVTLLGDAVHNMTPMAGMGANTALRDAEVLTRCLIDVAAGRIPLHEAVKTYEDEMRGYANAAIKLSTQNAVNACNGGTAQRLLFRGFLQAAATFPVIMKNTLGKSAIKAAR